MPLFLRRDVSGKHLTTSRYRDTIMTVKKKTKENKLIDMELLEEVAPTLRALAHPMRLRIIDFLKHGEQPVSKIIEATGKSQALTSHQLGLLRAHGVVKARREGNRVFYRIVDGPALVLLGCIQKHKGRHRHDSPRKRVIPEPGSRPQRRRR